MTNTFLNKTLYVNELIDIIAKKENLISISYCEKDGYDELTIKNKFIKFTNCENLYENINEMLDDEFKKFDDTIDYDYSEHEITIDQCYKKIKISNLHIENINKTFDNLIKYLTKKHYNEITLST